MAKINLRRLYFALCIVPFVGPFSIGLFQALIEAFQKNSFYIFTELPSILIFVSFFGLIISLPIMVFIGLPIIYVAEINRVKKIYTVMLYVLSAGLISFFILDDLGFYIGCLSGAVTSFIMLYKRDDWYIQESVEK